MSVVFRMLVPVAVAMIMRLAALVGVHLWNPKKNRIAFFSAKPQGGACAPPGQGQAEAGRLQVRASSFPAQVLTGGNGIWGLY